MINKKKVIIHVEDYFDPTAGYQINELLYKSKQFDDTVILITSDDMSPFHKEWNKKEDLEFTRKTKVKIIRLEKSFKILSRIIIKNMWKTIESFNPDVVYLHGIADFKDFILWKKKRRYSIYRDSHMSWVASKNKLNKFFYFLYRIMFSRQINKKNKYEKILALGIEEKEYIFKLGIAKNKVEMLPHGYNKDNMFFSESAREKLRKHYDIAKDQIVISYIGKFDNNKRPDLIFDILKKIKGYDNITLFFLGNKDDKYMKTFYGKKKNCKYNLILEDGKPFGELYKYYSFSDICIFPKETTLSSIHAQVCGCEVIMEEHISNQERVVNKDNLYEINNLCQASKILKNLLENKNKDRYKYIKHLKDREYSNQVKKINNLIKEGL